MNKHRSQKLDSMLGKKVLVSFFDNSFDAGILEWDEERERYRVCDTIFRKSHVRKVWEELRRADNGN